MLVQELCVHREILLGLGLSHFFAHLSSLAYHVSHATNREVFVLCRTRVLSCDGRQRRRLLLAVVCWASHCHHSVALSLQHHVPVAMRRCGWTLLSTLGKVTMAGPVRHVPQVWLWSRLRRGRPGVPPGGPSSNSIEGVAGYRILLLLLTLSVSIQLLCRPHVGSPLRLQRGKRRWHLGVLQQVFCGRLKPHLRSIGHWLWHACKSLTNPREGCRILPSQCACPSVLCGALAPGLEQAKATCPWTGSGILLTSRPERRRV